MAASGKFLYAQVEPILKQLFTNLSLWLNQFDNEALLGIAGEFRRCVEIIEDGIFLIGTKAIALANENISSFKELDFKLIEENRYAAHTETGFHIQLILVDIEDFYLEYFKLTGNQTHVDDVLKLAGTGPFKDEHEIYAKAGLSFIEPELREGLNEVELAQKNQLPNLITYADLKGTLHNHSDWSDGVHTLEEMALYCKDELKLEYLGICDHSKSAFYAKGLNEQRVYAQHQQIDELNKKLAPFKIFKGIESDILYDGSLDYSDDILKTFDFVVASVHSQLKMTEEKATQRLIKAIENPYTTILGHPTGRLLLSRKGYDIDYKKVIDACAANNVVIEINANPLRLDLDWRWHRYALDKGILLAINPDAHRKEKFYDMHYGILIGRKGGLTSTQCLNAFSLEEITSYFENKKI
jgi:DNA polymerase (family 10)